MGVLVSFENKRAVVSVAIDAGEITDARAVLVVAQAQIDAAIVAGSKSNADVQAEVAAEVARRTAARAEVTGLEEHAAAIEVAREAERAEECRTH